MRKVIIMFALAMGIITANNVPVRCIRLSFWALVFLPEVVT